MKFGQHLFVTSCFLLVTAGCIHCSAIFNEPVAKAVNIKADQGQQNVSEPETHAGASVVVEIPVSDDAFYSMNTYHGNTNATEQVSGYKGSYSGASGIAGVTDGKLDPSVPDYEATSSFSNVHTGSFASPNGVDSFGYAGTQAFQESGKMPGMLFGSGNIMKDSERKKALSGVGFMGSQLADGGGMAGTVMGAYGMGFKTLKHSGVISGGTVVRDSDSKTAVANGQTQTFSTQDDREAIGLATSEAQSATVGKKKTSADVKVQTSVQSVGAGVAGSVANAEGEGFSTNGSKIAATNTHTESFTIGSALAAAGSAANAVIDGVPGESNPIRNGITSMSNSGFSEVSDIVSMLPTKSMLEGNSVVTAANLGGSGNVAQEYVNTIVSSSHPLTSQIVGVETGSDQPVPSQVLGVHESWIKQDSLDSGKPIEQHSLRSRTKTPPVNRFGSSNVARKPEFSHINYQKFPNSDQSGVTGAKLLRNFGRPVLKRPSVSGYLGNYNNNNNFDATEYKVYQGGPNGTMKISYPLMNPNRESFSKNQQPYPNNYDLSSFSERKLDPPSPWDLYTQFFGKQPFYDASYRAPSHVNAPYVQTSATTGTTSLSGVTISTGGGDPDQKVIITFVSPRRTHSSAPPKLNVVPVSQVSPPDLATSTGPIQTSPEA